MTDQHPPSSLLQDLSKKKLIGDFSFPIDWDEEFVSCLDALEGEWAGRHDPLGRRDAVNRVLLERIQKAPEPAFLLSAVMHFIAEVGRRELLGPDYALSDFECWLNDFPELSSEEKQKIRGKIVGRYLPRESYQCFFPIGMGRRYPGPHFVTAHNPPDLDTSVASFWGWVDAFAARVSEGATIWNLPGDQLPDGISYLFDTLFGPHLLPLLPKRKSSLGLTAGDLAVEGDLLRRHADAPTQDIHRRAADKHVILVDQEGYYLGSWRQSDVEDFRLIAIFVSNCWRWFEYQLQVGLISLLAQETLEQEALREFICSLLQTPLGECPRLAELAEEQREMLAATFLQIFGLSEGLKSSFEGFMHALGEGGFGDFSSLERVLDRLPSKGLFDEEGRLREDRPAILREIEAVIASVAEAIERFRLSFDRLGVAVAVKRHVLQAPQQYVTTRADLEEIEATIGRRASLTVVEPAPDGRLIPVGVLRAVDLRRKPLATATLRDFCNRDEMGIPPEVEIISVADHHRASLHTSSFPTALLGDVQSCNVLLAEKAFELNDRYSAPLHKEEPASLALNLQSTVEMRLTKRRLARWEAHARGGEYFVHPRRAYCEYLSYLHAILDDTDLLSRVTARDLFCVAELLNRLKSLTLGEEVEVIHFDDLLHSPCFLQEGAERLLAHPELYSIYSKIYARREEEVQRELERCLAGERSTVFSDTKVQKGCARIGQTKVFPKNFPWLLTHINHFREVWLQMALQSYRHNPELEIHLQMISTIASAEQVAGQRVPDESHWDELWLWVPPTHEAHDRLSSYLSAFRASPEVKRSEELHVEFVGSTVERLQKVFCYHFRDVPSKVIEGAVLPLPIAIIRFAPGTITSRKGCITPYLPTLHP